MQGLATRAPERRELANSELGLGRHIHHGATCEPAAQLRGARDRPGDPQLGGRRLGDPHLPAPVSKARMPGLSGRASAGLCLLWLGLGLALAVAFAGRS